MNCAATAIRLTVNGGAMTLRPAATIADVVQQLAVRGRYAVEVNGEIVPRSLHTTQLLSTGDRVEVVAAIGGG